MSALTGLFSSILGDNANTNNSQSLTGLQNGGAFDLHNANTDYSYSDQNAAATSNSHDIGGSFNLTDILGNNSADHSSSAGGGSGLLGL